MGSTVIYPQGGNGTVFALAAGDSIALWSEGDAKLYQIVSYVDQPDSVNLVGTFQAGDDLTVFGAYAAGGNFRVEAGASKVYVQYGADPRVPEANMGKQRTPTSLNATGAVTTDKIFSGIVTSTTAAAVAGTIPTGTVMDASANWNIGDSVDWSVINTGGANAFTVTAATGHTVFGAAAVAASTSGMFRTRKTGANTFVTYRIG